MPYFLRPVGLFVSVFILAIISVPWIFGQERNNDEMAPGPNAAVDRMNEAPKVSVGENVQVSSANKKRPHYELDLVSHPTDPKVLLGAGMVWTDAEDKYDVVVYRSSDGGQHWTPTLEVARRGVTQDPTLALDRDGQAYLAEFGSGKMLLHRSPDSGKSWCEPRKLYGMDRPWISVSSRGAAHEGRVYVHGKGGAGDADIAVVRADSNGANFLSRTDLDLASGNRRVLTTGNSVILSDGTIVFPYLVRIGDIGRYEAETSPNPRVEREHNALLKVAVSQDGGERFEAETVARWFHRFGRGQSATMSSLAVDTSTGPFQDRLYVAWTDFRSGSGQILLSHSNDQGKHWSDPLVVNRNGGPAFRPELAVNREGVLGISWYDRRDSPTGLGWSVRFAASVDGGVTVTPSVRVSEEAFRYSWDRGLVVKSRSKRGRYHKANTFLHAFNDIGGHTAGFAADAKGVFHPFWVDNRTGVPQIWTAPVDVEGESVRHGASSLAGLQDVTSKTALIVERSQYDDSTHTVTLEARLQNRSNDTIRAPVVLRIIDLWSEFGEVELAGRFKGRRSHGAVLPMTPHLENGRIPPDSSTSSITLRAEIESPKALGTLKPPPPGRRVPGYAILQTKAKALGQIGAPAGSQ